MANDNGNTPEQAAAQAAPSRIVADFKALGSAEFKLIFENVTGEQMMVVAAKLEWYARRMFDQAAAQQGQARPGIVVPGMTGYRRPQ